MLGLTREQARVKAAIAHLSRDGWAPSYEEIAHEVGLVSRSAILGHLRALRDRGHIDFDRRARSIRIIGHLEGLDERSTPDLRALRDRINKILMERSQ